MLEAGQLAPGFALEDISGKKYSLEEASAQGPVLVVFFKISCPTCQLTLPFLDRLKTNLPVLGISQNDPSSTKEFLDYFKISFPVLIDPASDRYKVSKAYRLTNVPSSFLIESDRTISWALNGFHRAELEALAQRFGVVLFNPADKVPLMKPG